MPAVIGSNAQSTAYEEALEKLSTAVDGLIQTLPTKTDVFELLVNVSTKAARMAVEGIPSAVGTVAPAGALVLLTPIATAGKGSELSPGQLSIQQSSRRPSADVRAKADQAATGEDGKLRCAYCGKELTKNRAKQTRESMIT